MVQSLIHRAALPVRPHLTLHAHNRPADRVVMSGRYLPVDKRVCGLGGRRVHFFVDGVLKSYSTKTNVGGRYWLKRHLKHGKRRLQTKVNGRI